jgi:type III secretion protein S
MNEIVVRFLMEALTMVAVISAIPLAASALTGLLLGLIQAATQVQEQSFVYAAKISSAAAALYWTRAYWIFELQHSFLESCELAAALQREWN